MSELQTDESLERIMAVWSNPKNPYRLWSWPDPSLSYRDQQRVVELGVTASFWQAFEALEDRSIFKSIQSCEAARPDTVILTLEGQRIGVEVTELLDQESEVFRARIWRESRIAWEGRRWTKEDLITELRRRVQAKSAKPPFQGGPYDKSILIIYCVERGVDVRFKEIARRINEQCFGSASKFDEVYFLVPPYPMKPHPQLCKLPLTRIFHEN